MKFWTLAAASLALAAMVDARPAAAQMAVFDFANVTQAISQLQQMKTQYQQLQQTHASFNNMTDLSGVMRLLQNPQVRNVLPSDYNAVMAALKGQGGGAASFRDQNAIYTPSGTAYDAQVRGYQNANAGAQSVSQQMYEGAGKRITALQALQTRASACEDPACKADVANAINSEMAIAQAQLMQGQAVAMTLEAQRRVDEQQKAEAFEKSLRDEIQAIRTR